MSCSCAHRAGTAEAQGNAAAPAEGLPRGVHAAERPLPRSRDGAAAADTAAESPSRPAVDQPVDRGGPSPDAGDRRGLEDAWDRGRSVSVGLSPSECARPWSPEVVVPDVSFGGDGGVFAATRLMATAVSYARSADGGAHA